MQSLEALDRWVGGRPAGEPARPGALRVVYIEQQTGLFSRQVQALIDRRLAALAPVLAAALAPLPDVLADPGGELDWSR